MIQHSDVIELMLVSLALDSLMSVWSEHYRQTECEHRAELLRYSELLAPRSGLVSGIWYRQPGHDCRHLGPHKLGEIINDTIFGEQSYKTINYVRTVHKQFATNYCIKVKNTSCLIFLGSCLLLVVPKNNFCRKIIMK